MSGKSNKSPAGAILALLILVIIVVALIFILRGGGDDENEDLNTPPAEAGEVSDAPSQPSEGEDEDGVNVPTPPAESPVHRHHQDQTMVDHLYANPDVDSIHPVDTVYSETG